jgi:hypothetical protein
VKKPYTKPEVTAPNEPNYDVELTKFENLLLRDLEVVEENVTEGGMSEYRRRKIAGKLALAFSLGAHYGYRYAGGDAADLDVYHGPLSEEDRAAAAKAILRALEEEPTHDPAGEPHAR